MQKNSRQKRTNIQTQPQKYHHHNLNLLLLTPLTKLRSEAAPLTYAPCTSTPKLQILLPKLSLRCSMAARLKFIHTGLFVSLKKIRVKVTEGVWACTMFLSAQCVSIIYNRICVDVKTSFLLGPLSGLVVWKENEVIVIKWLAPWQRNMTSS